MTINAGYHKIHSSLLLMDVQGFTIEVSSVVPMAPCRDVIKGPQGSMLS